MVSQHAAHRTGTAGLTVPRMSRVCEAWSLEDLCGMEEEDMDALLAFFQSGSTPRLDELRPEPSGWTPFDGSFGWF